MMRISEVMKIEAGHGRISRTKQVDQLDIVKQITSGEEQVLYKPRGVEVHEVGHWEWSKVVDGDKTRQVIYRDTLRFEEEDDEAGIDIELNSDFLLSAVNVVVRND